MGDHPQNGAIQITNGKMRMYIDEKWQDFGVAFIVSDMRKVAKPRNNRVSAYAIHLKRMASLLESGGIVMIKPVQDILKLFFGCKEYWMQHDCRIWHGWLQQIWQFKNVTGKRDEPEAKKANKNFRDNFEKVFTSA